MINVEFVVRMLFFGRGGSLCLLERPSPGVRKEPALTRDDAIPPVVVFGDVPANEVGSSPGRKYCDWDEGSADDAGVELSDE